MCLTFVVLLHIKLAQQHDGLLSEKSSVDGIRRIHAVVGMHRHHASAAAETVVEAPEVHRPDAVLPQRGGTHDARLNGDVQVGLLEDGLRMLGHDFRERDELGVARALSDRRQPRELRCVREGEVGAGWGGRRGRGGWREVG